MKKVLMILMILLFPWMGISSAKTSVNVKAVKRGSTSTTDPNRAPFECPVSVTFDPETREIEISEYNDFVEIQLLDEYENWFFTFGRTPCSYILPANQYGKIVITMESYDWYATASFYAPKP